jgi:hypothetical protein
MFFPGFFLESEEISAPPPFGFLTEVYIFYENWSTETYNGYIFKEAFE